MQRASRFRSARWPKHRPRVARSIGVRCRRQRPAGSHRQYLRGWPLAVSGRTPSKRPIRRHYRPPDHHLAGATHLRNNPSDKPVSPTAPVLAAGRPAMPWPPYGRAAQSPTGFRAVGRIGIPKFGILIGRTTRFRLLAPKASMPIRPPACVKSATDAGYPHLACMSIVEQSSKLFPRRLKPTFRQKAAQEKINGMPNKPD